LTGTGSTLAALRLVAGAEVGRTSALHGHMLGEGWSYKQEQTEIPSSFDWRDVNGVNYLFPVVDQVWTLIFCHSFNLYRLIHNDYLKMSKYHVDKDRKGGD